MKIQATDQKTSSVESKGQKRKIGSPKKPRPPVKRKKKNQSSMDSRVTKKRKVSKKIQSVR